MRYFVDVGGRTFTVDVAGSVVTVDGRAMHAELRAVPGTALRHLLLDARSHTFHAGARNGGKGWDLHLDGYRFEVEAVDERARAIRETTARSTTPRGPKPVRAPMPGLIVRVEVEPGQDVRPGQGVAIIEAMKMENELRAEGGGVVARVLVTAGQAVEKGTVLIEFRDA